MKRRFFLNRFSMSMAGVLLLPHAGVKAALKKKEQRKIVLKAGICSDVHRDLIPDSEERLQTFIDDMNKRGDIDFIIQLGDFCCPYDRNLPFLNIWNKFKGPAYHVIGNHETDGGFTHDQVVSFLGAKDKYYSFDTNGFHFVVLNGNEKNPDNPPKGYPRYIGEEQRCWLADDLYKTRLPVIAFCHQAFDIDIQGSIEQATYTRLIFERANEKAGMNKVRLVFSGHHHSDFHNVINGIHYVQINSMSYYWIGEKYQRERYSKEIDEKYPNLRYTIPYKDPLWAVMTIYDDGEIFIEGRKSEFVGPSPSEMGIGLYDEGYPIVPFISDRQLKY